jgi:hypothetical protein
LLNKLNQKVYDYGGRLMEFKKTIILLKERKKLRELEESRLNLLNHEEIQMGLINTCTG